MASEVGICNMALSRIGQSRTISQLGNANEAERACALWYEQCRDEVLEDFPWSFAGTFVELAEVDVPIPGWTYVYRYPTDCMQARQVVTSEGVRYGMALSANDATPIFPDDVYSVFQTKIPFVVMNDPVTVGTRLIATDLQDAYLLYTHRITDPNQYPAQFITALSWRLAMELALILKADARLAENARLAYEAMKSRAQAGNLNEGTPDRAPDSPSIMARW